MSEHAAAEPVEITFAGLAGVPEPAPLPTAMPRAAGEALRVFFDAHPLVDHVRFEIALNEDGDDLEFSSGTLHALDGRALQDDLGREVQRAGEAFRRLLRREPAVATLPVALVIATGSAEHVFVIRRASTEAGPAEALPPAAARGGAAGDAAHDARAADRERARLAALDARFDGRDVVPDDDHAA
jgi:hypothetical protein